MHAIDTPFHIYVLLSLYVLFKLAINSIVQYLFNIGGSSTFGNSQKWRKCKGEKHLFGGFHQKMQDSIVEESSWSGHQTRWLRGGLWLHYKHLQKWGILIYHIQDNNHCKFASLSIHFYYYSLYKCCLVSYKS